ncbi:MAG: glycoside hydrolase family 127 protein, partial [Bacteroidales bacterium]
PESNIYGTEPYFGCCTANGHQGWPKFAQSLWMASPDGGLAAISYAPCIVNALAGNQVPVKIEVKSNYPFEESVQILVNPEKKSAFPIHLRIPAWTVSPAVTVNGETIAATAGEFLVINRKWSAGDRIELNLTSPIRTETRYNNSVAIAKGPLYFSLRIPKTYTPVILKRSYEYMGSTDWQIEPAGYWNYGLLIDPDNPAAHFEVVTNPVGPYPFGDAGDPVYNAGTQTFDTLVDNPPIILKTKGILIPGWELSENSAAAPPYSPVALTSEALQEAVGIELIPYGSARLRVSEIPVIKK